MTSFRMQRINKELLREISILLQSEIKDERAKRAILIEVDCSKDLSHAKVYYTTLRKEDREEVQKGLDKASKLIRSILGRQMHLRQIPELRFEYDLVEEKARKLEAVLDSIKSKEDSKKEGPEESL
ncbi:ribosome-binding factor A [Thermovirga lienii DSM 17291]|uniref:Ribosome-binding factor A n=1 Tax=Thermovirga lienii (strain ATCC BAA-1197 / DSM 17291 / Cas60314) TaxID=580340 RepID=G7V9V9_THELD|nr:30S ribosome-binding factor RbfA [Thermovirga lienii]AER66659.1 ribosome-binding factor A [Thermovirga lienii DSM 17291]MDN5318392.1 ribosome-binding factor [Thermovirga sp.]MDN5367941.1 ribosome-binding factor [Thermovirga sp.]